MGRAKPDRTAPKPSFIDGGVNGKLPRNLSMADAVERVEKKRKASGAKKIGKLIEDHPDEAVTVLRGWLHQSQ